MPGAEPSSPGDFAQNYAELISDGVVCLEIVHTR